MILRGFAKFIERPAGEVMIGFALMLAGHYWDDAGIKAAGTTLISRAMISGALAAVRGEKEHDDRPKGTAD